MKGVIPAAGLGTRLLPATKAQPKEMLPLVDKPTIQYVVEEAASAGLTEVVIVVGPNKTSIAEHFNTDPETIQRFERAGKLPELAQTLDLIRRIPIRFVTQKEPLGLGHAVYQARHAIGDEPFAVLLGDDIILSEKPATKDLVEQVDGKRRTIIGVEKLPHEELQRYGVIDPVEKEGRLRRVKDLVEKPAPGKEPSDFGIVGRYVLSPGIFDAIKGTAPGRNGEIQLTDALRLLLKKEPLHMLQLQGRRLDVGGKFEWLRANVELALRDPELGARLREYIRTIK
ncbi:MAG TPA: UTP--glucose-1-phosphate uridylyltransferase [Candidatus Thermoplasmatota archaeon]|nr:UTP--glucose-1-phosphate uridylyltransferase [Candidatus Thermoplasmatota archaeon]